MPFSERYEERRGRNDPGGYHELLDALESDFVERYARGRDVLEVGCGTGLVLERISALRAKRARRRSFAGDAGQSERARARRLRGLGDWRCLSHDNSFDVVCSFKVLAHVPEIGRALAEMARVTRPGGVVIAEFYNSWSLRAWVKRLLPPGAIAKATHEGQCIPATIHQQRSGGSCRAGCRVIGERGIRIVTPTAHLMRVPLVRDVFRRSEWRLADTPLRFIAGFYVVAARKEAT